MYRHKPRTLKAVKTDSSGALQKVEQQYFGGTYSLWEVIRKQGIGSPKIIYASGIETFDYVEQGAANEVAFVNFELLRNGLILRLNRRQMIRCAGIRLSDLLMVNLEARPIKVSARRYGWPTTKIVHGGTLHLVSTAAEVCSFTVLVRDFPQLLSFFEKAEFAGKFEYSVSMDPPEEDDLLRGAGILDAF